MNENTDEEVGSVKVKISSKEIHRAVRNILANEMKLDPIEIKEKVRAEAFEVVKKEVIEQIHKEGYGTVGLKDWAKRSMEARMNDVNKILKEVVRELVHEKIHEEIIQVVEAIVKDGLEVRVGWNRKVKVKVEKQKES